jgi:ketosteroid isomerase-like protein
MSTEQNKALFSRLLDELNRGNLGVVDQVIAPDAVLISPHLPEPVRGRQAFKDAFGGIGIEALGVQYPPPEEMIAEGDSVAVRFIARGTHRGEFAGAAPTGKPFTLNSVVFYRVANGQIVEYRLSWDALGFLQQVGALPAAAGGTS